MILTNLSASSNKSIRWINIEGRRIISIGSDGDNNFPINATKIEFDKAFVFPGLINSHDHLEFNLFPKLGNKKYEDYLEWGEDIHKNNLDIINKIKSIPYDLRLRYGIYKNIFNGVTTVVHHGNTFVNKEQLIDIHRDYHYLHSIVLENKWKLKLNLKVGRLPFLVHIGEGKNESSYSEIDKFLRWNLFKRPVIGIHGIMMDPRQAENFKALVWCPLSNDFLYGKTCKADMLKTKTNILFGTDSNLSAEWNIWEHLRYARNTRLLSDTELFNSLTLNAATVWGLNELGIISAGYKADLAVAVMKKENFLDSFFSTGPEDILLLMKMGEIILFDSTLSNQLKNSGVILSNFSEFEINGKFKYVKGKLKDLCNKILSFAPDTKFPFNY